MISTPIYQVDAFNTGLFSGNPAAVCPLQEWISEELMQAIASENNLSETAFIVKEGNQYGIRWFTPEVEVNLCGHATLASGHVLFEHLDYPESEIHFNSPRSGSLKVLKHKNMLAIDFPVRKFESCVFPQDVSEAVGGIVLECFGSGNNYMMVYNSEDELSRISPDFKALKRSDCLSLIVTAPGKEVDFVSRFFAPQLGVNEDPVTGSAHTTLTPYWSERLNKTEMTAKQLSTRGGYLECELRSDRVLIAGNATTFLQGEIYLADTKELSNS